MCVGRMVVCHSSTAKKGSTKELDRVEWENIKKDRKRK